MIVPATAIHFARVCTFYFKHRFGSWFFQVEVKCRKSLNPQTGMSVNLVLLDEIMTRIFHHTICKTKAPIHFLQQTVQLLNRELLHAKIELVSVQFDEKRDFGFHFKDGDIRSIRHNLAEDEKKDLYQIVSYFNQLQQLTEIHLQNLKTKVTEHIIF